MKHDLVIFIFRSVYRTMSTLTGEAGSSATKGDQSVINQSGGSQPPNPSGHHHHHVQGKYFETTMDLRESNSLK